MSQYAVNSALPSGRKVYAPLGKPVWAFASSRHDAGRLQAVPSPT
jgi:hypothetical protein